MPFHVYRPGATSLPDAPAVAVLYTNSPVAGDATVAASSVPVSATRGGKNPLFDAAISSFAEAWGLVVPMPTWAEAPKESPQAQTER